MMMFAVTLRPGAYLLSARCRNTHLYDKENKNKSTLIHLVHGPTPWMQSQLDALEEIAQNYPGFHIELIVVQNEVNYVNTEDKSANKEPTQPGYSDGQHNKHKPTETTKHVQENNTSPTTLESHTKSENPIKVTHPEELKRVKRIKRHSKHKQNANRKKKYYPWEKIQLNINIGTRKLLKMFLNHKVFEDPFGEGRRHKKGAFQSQTQLSTNLPLVHGIQDLIKMHSNIHMKNSTYEEIFKHSPLHFSWQNLNQITRLFAVRVLQMWNFAGITFDLPEFLKTPESLKTIPINNTKAPINDKSNTTNTSSVQKSFAENEGKYKRLIIVGLPSFEQLPEGLVTVDDNGLHMETKTICHAFFGEILINFKGATLETMPADIIKRTLKTFCKRGAVDTDYCKNITT
ncbi:hypothetical protein ILUMI_07992 [Ignelater luminosus]|uniref:Uncharacterized protein n=1 Tax=Ignelater luminosus TaxID=2038154 RepID=A0A8K0D7Q9_IGNLU|nr:hypothetical protein ILUMI_07992 [Ignelater luminosus]